MQIVDFQYNTVLLGLQCRTMDIRVTQLLKFASHTLRYSTGEVYEFNVYHTVQTEDPCELSQIEIVELEGMERK